MFLQLFLSFWDSIPTWVIFIVIIGFVITSISLIVKFSKKYSKKNREQTKAIRKAFLLKKGMSKEEVFKMMGNPYYSDANYWIYRQYVYNNNPLVNHTKEGTTEVRIRFDENGLVSEVSNAHDITTTTYYQR